MIVICVFVFCYGKILVVICRQARVVAGHSGPGSSTSQTQLSQIKSIVIKMMILVCAFHIITPGYICYLIVHSTSDLPISLHTSLPCSWDFFEYQRQPVHLYHQPPSSQTHSGRSGSTEEVTASE